MITEGSSQNLIKIHMFKIEIIQASFLQKIDEEDGNLTMLFIVYTREIVILYSLLSGGITEFKFLYQVFRKFIMM